MYVFDTNVISEVMKGWPDAGVAAWLSACLTDKMFTTTICQSEILYGVRRLSQGRRRARLLAAAEAMFARSFADRVLPFDAAAASACADIRIARERAGRPLTQEDGMIAAIAKVAAFKVPTRDEVGLRRLRVPTNSIRHSSPPRVGNGIHRPPGGPHTIRKFFSSRSWGGKAGDANAMRWLLSAPRLIFY